MHKEREAGAWLICKQRQKYFFQQISSKVRFLAFPVSGFSWSFSRDVSHSRDPVIETATNIEKRDVRSLHGRNRSVITVCLHSG